MIASTLSDLLNRLGPALTLFARQWCWVPEDAVQDAFCKLALESPFPDDPAAWLFRAVRHRAIDLDKAERRRREREKKSAREDWFLEKSIGEYDADQAIAALQNLPLEEREIVIAKVWGGLTFEKIAVAFGVSVTTAHRRYDSALTQLRERLHHVRT